MKRIISLVLILILSLGVLSACQDTPAVSQYDVEAVKEVVHSMYVGLLDNPETKKDFTLVSAAMNGGYRYTITWTTDCDAIVITPKDEFEVTVDVPELGESAINYKLTGTITAPDNTTATLEYDLVIPAMEVEPILNLMGDANLISSTTEETLFKANGVTFTILKGTSTTAITQGVQTTYAQRAYAGTILKVEYTGMRKIVITCDDYSPDGTKVYYTGMDGMEIEGATIVRKDAVITILFDKAVNVFESLNLAGQMRIEQIEVATTLTAEDEVLLNGGGNSGEASEYQAPAANTAFKLFMDISTMKYYFAGTMSGDYLATTTDLAQAADVFFEVVDGGYHIYFMNGESKTYINAAGYKKSNGYLGCHFELGETPNCVWTYNDTFGILEVYAELEGLDPDTFFAGTYGSYTTVSLSGSYYKAQISSGTQFPARLVLSSEAGNEAPAPHVHNYVDGKCACGEMDPNYVPPVTEGLSIVTAPAVGTAYKFGLYHGNESANVFFNGENYNNYAWYFAYTTDVAGAVDVYLETVEGVEGGYRLYFDNNGVKTYMVAFPRDGDTTKGTLKFDTVVPSEYYTFSAEHNTLIYTSTTGEQFYIGSSGTYKSISLSAISYITSATSYISHLYAEGAQGGETPAPHEHVFVSGKCECGETDPNYVPEGGDGEEDGLMSIPEVLASAEGTAVVVKGTVQSFYYTWDDSYGNCSVYIVDDAGNKLLCFRLKTKVNIGDEITVTGSATVYNGTVQIAAGCTAVINNAHVCSEFTEGSCVADTFCVVCGALGTKAEGHNYVNGTCSNCGAVEPTGDYLPGNLAFSAAANKADADAYMKTNFPEWKITGKLGQTYAGYIGFGRSGDTKSALTSPEFSTSTGFTVVTVLKGNGSSGVATSTLTFTLVDASGNTVATGYAEGTTTAAITPVDAKDTTYTISFTFVEGKTWADATNLVVTFAKATGNIGMKSLDFVK